MKGLAKVGWHLMIVCSGPGRAAGHGSAGLRRCCWAPTRRRIVITRLPRLAITCGTGRALAMLASTASNPGASAPASCARSARWQMAGSIGEDDSAAWFLRKRSGCVGQIRHDHPKALPAPLHPDHGSANSPVTIRNHFADPLSPALDFRCDLNHDAFSQLAHRLQQRVVVPLRMRPGVLGACRGAQRVQHRPHHRGALLVSGHRTPPRHPGTSSPAAPRGPRRPGRAPHRGGTAGTFRGQPGQVPQVHPGTGGRQQDRVRGRAAVLREPRPLADRPAVRFRQIPGGQRRHHLRMRPGARGPRGMRRRDHLGDPGVVDQPGAGTVVRIRGVALAGGERGQERRPDRRADRIGLLQPDQVWAWVAAASAVASAAAR